ncbi:MULTISPECIES: hypothetical protein [unclassified Saccharothrix]|uniref:hypothetical protein n=1 Tax=unclassified Saccharothrix TaxID=2593673 RepID=UPI00307D3FF6
MPITIARGAQMRGWELPKRRLVDDMDSALAEVLYANLWRQGKTIAEYGKVRIDNQGPWTQGPGQNIQAQTGNDSIAGVLLANTLGNAGNPIDQGAVVDAVRRAMSQSVQDGYFYQVTGTVPEALAEPGTPDQAVTAETTSG